MVWVEKLGSQGSSRCGGGSAPRSLHTGSGQGFEEQRASGNAGGQRNEVAHAGEWVGLTRGDLV